jgi:transcriptional regulator with XRE-family HTH domain
MSLQSADKGVPMSLDIGSAIRIVRQAKGMKLGSLAEAAGLSAPFLSLVESGARDPSLAALRRISESLSIPVEALMVLAQPPNGMLNTTNAKAKRLAESIRQLADAEERLKRRLSGHGRIQETARPST